MSGALLTAHGLAVGHRAPVLRDVTFAVHAGESWFVLGDNGAVQAAQARRLPRVGVLDQIGGQR